MCFTHVGSERRTSTCFPLVMRSGPFGFSLISWRSRRRPRCLCLKSLILSSSVPIYTPFIHRSGERHCESKVCFARTQHNNPGQGSTARSGDERTNHEATALPRAWSWKENYVKPSLLTRNFFALSKPFIFYVLIRKKDDRSQFYVVSCKRNFTKIFIIQVWSHIVRFGRKR